MDKELDRIQIKDIIRRRKKSFILISTFLFLVGFIVAIALPPIYKSEAMIRVEDQEIQEGQEGFVQQTTDDYVEQRIGKINQQILSRPKLEEIVNKFNLYDKDKNQADISVLVAKLREDILLETIVSEMQSKPGGRHLSFTVAFNLSYQGKDPATVQKVASTLADLYIKEDIKSTKRTLSATSDFLEAELDRLKKDIEIQEKKISEFKEKHSRELPSDLGYNIQAVSRLERELDRANLELRTLTEKKIFLESQLSQVEPLSPIVVEGEKIATNPNQRLKELNIQLTKLKSIYSNKHPDTKKLKREIRELESQVHASDDSIEKVKRLRQLENELAELESKLGSKHPDVKALKKEIALLSQEVDNQITETAILKISEEKPDNPAYISLVTQINAAKTDMLSIEEDKQNIVQSIEKYQKRIEKGPVVEKEFNALTRDYEAAKNKYNEIWNELTAAQGAQKVEGNQRGRRFSIASQAYLPTKPFKPNRLAVILVSFLVAIGTSSLFAAFKESMDNSVKSTDQIRQITNVPVLTSISYIVTDSDKRARRLKKFVWLFLIIIIVVSGIYFADQYIVNLEDLWSIFLERIKVIT
jgi:uncharacterized protein involved in exopolysaccharide biosynthesis